MKSEGIAPGLHGVPETAVWTLYHRARYARWPNPWIQDPKAIEIVDGLDYPFLRRFGPPIPAVAIRAAAFDRAVMAFLQQSPNGQVVSLGEGLETQRFRVDNGQRTWLTVDLPESIRLRERFIEPDERHRHAAVSALDERWLTLVDPDKATFVAAQGLLMYLPAADVRQLMSMLARRLPGASMMFDVVPDWVRWWTDMRLPAAIGYIPPRMRWSFDETQLDVLKGFLPPGSQVEVKDYGYPSGPMRRVFASVRRSARLRSVLPALLQIDFPVGARGSA